MKKLNQKLLLLFILFSAFTSFAERTNDKEAHKLLRHGNQHFVIGEYFEAIPFYEQYVAKVKTDAKAYYRLGVSYLNIHGKGKALPYIKKAHELDPKVAEDIEFELGDAYHYHSQFEEAILHYNNYLKIHEKDPKTKRFIKRRIYECENGIEFVKNPVKIKLENLGGSINTDYDEYAPVISANEDLLIFTSNREGTTGNSRDELGEFSEDIYISRYINGEWTKAENLSVLNTYLSDACVSLSPDGKKLITWRPTGNGDLFYSIMGDHGKWQEIQIFPEHISNKHSNEESAAISKDWLTLIFSSDRKGGYGGLDLYMSTRKSKDDAWGTPVNLGEGINTEYDDDAPFIDIDNTLYFSSQGHKGMGGFDIFKAEYAKKEGWSNPTNLGYPINSVDDDIFYVVAGDGKYAYFNSVKEGLTYGAEDIYRVRLFKEEHPEVKDRQKILEEITGKEIVLETVMVAAKDFDTDEILSESEITIYDKSNKTIANSTEDDKDDTHLFKLDLAHLSQIQVHAEHQGYLPKTVLFKLDRDHPAHEFTVPLKKIEKEAKLALHNINFESDKSDFAVESALEIDKLVKFMKSHPNVTARLEGHTDNIGSDEYNLQLSKARCESVEEYMVSQGIDHSRIESIGYGETKPLADNKTPKGRERNRRIEFVIDSH